MSYPTPADLRAAKSIEGTTGRASEALLQDAIDAWTEAIEIACERVFTQTAGASVSIDVDRARRRFFPGDIVSLTRVRIDGVEVQTGEYQLSRLTPLTWWPYEMLSFDGYVQPGSQVTLSGTFGWPEVPQAVNAAIIELAATWGGQSARSYQATKQIAVSNQQSPRSRTQPRPTTPAKMLDQLVASFKRVRATDV